MPEKPKQPKQNESTGKTSRRGRGEGSIFQRASGRWVAQISDAPAADGSRTRTTISGKTKKEVQEKLRAEQLKIDNGAVIVKSNLTLDDAVRLWLKNSVAVSSSGATLENYARTYRLWVEKVIGKIELKALNIDHIDTCLDHMAEKGKDGGYRQIARLLLISALDYAITKGLIATNPASSTVRPRYEHVEFQVLDKGQAVKFIRACQPERLAALWQTAIQTGMRIGELLALQKIDIDLDAGLINVRRTQSIVVGGEIILKPPKTNAGKRSITIGSVLTGQLREHFARMAKEGLQDSIWAFPDPHGEMLVRWREPKSSFRRIINRAGVPKIRVHDTRHTHATLLLMAGENIKVVSERLGHSSVVITLKTYGHVLPNMQQAAAARVDQLFQ